MISLEPGNMFICLSCAVPCTGAGNNDDKDGEDDGDDDLTKCHRKVVNVYTF